MTEPIYLYFYDKDVNQVIRVGPNGFVNPAWMPLPPHYAHLLIEGQARGEVIYVNQSGDPALWPTPVKPTLAWDERAILAPLNITDGVAYQSWLVDKLTIPEKLEKLKELRYYKQSTITVPMRIQRFGLDGELMSKTITTDQGTWAMMNASAVTAMMEPDVVFKNWKFDNDDWAPVKGSELLKTWREASRKVEECFDIEAHYSKAIQAGIPVDITQWVLIDLPLGHI